MTAVRFRTSADLLISGNKYEKRRHIRHAAIDRPARRLARIDQGRPASGIAGRGYGLERVRFDWLRRGRGGLAAGQGGLTSRTGVRRGGATQYRGQYGRHRQAGQAEYALGADLLGDR